MEALEASLMPAAHAQVRKLTEFCVTEPEFWKKAWHNTADATSNMDQATLHADAQSTANGKEEEIWREGTLTRSMVRDNKTW